MPASIPLLPVSVLLALVSCVEPAVDDAPSASVARIEAKEFVLQTGSRRTLGVPCWEGVLLDRDAVQDGWQTSCAVTLLAGPGGPERSLRACDPDGDPHAPCWRNVVHVACDLTPTALALELAGVGPADHGTVARAQCELE
ncbi:MAG: hypothetical protein KBG28_21225 [Kofleriaceae bacterium]|nr:hypothetical protein [Kofleriaceae bacterium]